MVVLAAIGPFWGQAEQPTADLSSLDLSELLEVTIDDPKMFYEHSDGDGKGVIQEKPKPGLIFNYSYSYVENEGYQQGRRTLSDQDVVALFPVVPVQITQQAHLFSLAFVPNENWAIQATLPYLHQSTFHLRRNGAPFVLDSEGIGDVSIQAIRNWRLGNDAIVYAGFGFGIPTGSTSETGDTPRGPNSQLPYAMQLGSGTWDLKPTVGGTKQLGPKASTGLSFSSVVRLGTNERSYTLGNRFQGELWYSHDVTEWLSLEPRITGIYWEEIAGQDPEVTLGIAPVAEPFNYGGWRIDAGLAAQVRMPGLRNRVSLSFRQTPRFTKI